MDLLGAELSYGVLLCGFRNSDDGIRRCWNVAAIASKHHGDESLTVERAFFQPGWVPVDARRPKGTWMMAARTGWRGAR